MIRPAGFRGAAFGSTADGDARKDATARATLAADLGIVTDWAFVSQVHGATVIEATRPGYLGEADALFTAVRGLPMMVATADCVPIVVEGDAIAGVIHAGWRGLAAGVIPATLAAIVDAGYSVVRAGVGPAIGPCCYEVGDEVAARFPGFAATTDAGTTSVDLGAVAAAQLGGIVTFRSGDCTRCEPEYNSHRRDATTNRQVAVAWLPTD